MMEDIYASKVIDARMTVPMQAKWSKQSSIFNQSIFLDLLIKSAFINSESRLSFSGFDYLVNKSMLSSMLLIEGGEVFSSRTVGAILDSALDVFIRNALSEGVKTNNSPDVFLDFVNLKVKEYLKRPKGAYCVVTSLSVSGKLPIKKIVGRGVETVLYEGGIPKKFNTRKQLDKEWKGSDYHTPPGYAGIVSVVSARNLDDAMAAAIDQIDYLRGILSFYANPVMSISLNGVRHGSINKIRLGGMHTVHEESGKLASDQYWYESDFKTSREFHFEPVKLKSVRSSICKVMNRIESISGGEKIKDAIIRYIRALDEKNKDHTIIKLWGALESVVGKNDSGEFVVKRCSFLFKDREYVRQTLEVARVYRNRNVHGDHSSSVANEICYHLHSVFRSLIMFYAGTKDLVSVADINSLLDMPGDSRELMRETESVEKKLYLLRKAKKLRGG